MKVVVRGTQTQTLSKESQNRHFDWLGRKREKEDELNRRLGRKMRREVVWRELKRVGEGEVGGGRKGLGRDVMGGRVGQRKVA